MLQVEKLKAWQAAQEREASLRPEAKRWIDPAIIERCVLSERNAGHPVFSTLATCAVRVL